MNQHNIDESALIKEYAKLISSNPSFFSITVTKTVTKTDNKKVTETITSVKPVKRVLKNKDGKNE